MGALRLYIVLFSFTAIFVLYQNFGMIAGLQSNDVRQVYGANYDPKKHSYDPKKSIQQVEEYCNKNLARVEQEESQRYFDHKKFLKQKWKESAIYGRMKEWLEVSDSELAPNSKEGELQASEETDESEVKMRVDPLKSKAMVRYIGSINADVAYVQDEANLQMKVYKNIDPQTQIQLQHDSNQDKTYIQYQYDW